MLPYLLNKTGSPATLSVSPLPLTACLSLRLRLIKQERTGRENHLEKKESAEVRFKGIFYSKNTFE